MQISISPFGSGNMVKLKKSRDDPMKVRFVTCREEEESIKSAEGSICSVLIGRFDQEMAIVNVEEDHVDACLSLTIKVGYSVILWK